MPTPTTSLPALNLPQIKQAEDYDCGATALAIIYKFAGRSLPEAYLKLSNSYRGMPPEVMESALQAEFSGVAYGVGWTISDLEHHIANGRPVAVLVSVEVGSDHWVVVRGVQGGKVLFSDPAHGRRSKGIRRWLEWWQGPDDNPYKRYGVAVW